MDEMLRTEREIPKTVIRGQEKPHAEALRANAIYDALIERRANWYQKYRPNLEAAPEVTPKKATRYGRQAVRLIEATEKQGDFIQELKDKGLKESTIKGWQKRIGLASRVLQEKFAGEGVALSGGKVPAEEEAPEAAPPEIAPEPKRVGGETAMRPPGKPEEIPLSQLDIGFLATEARIRRGEMESMPSVDQQTKFYHESLEPLEYELNRRTNNAFYWVDDALRCCYEAIDKAPVDLYGMHKAMTNARATLQHAKDLKAEISDVASLTFIKRQIDMIESKYKYVQAEFQERKALYPEVKLPPVEVPEKPRISLVQMWKGARERFKIGVGLKVGERLKALGRPFSSEKAKALLERQKAAARERKEALGRTWERMGGISVLPSASAVKDWVDKIWAKASTPFGKLTEEEMETALAAQKIERKIPEFNKVKEWQKAWQEMDPETRRKIAIRVGIGAAVGVVSGLVAYEIIGRHGREFQVIAQNFSGVTQAAREMLARAPTPTELPKPVTEVAEGARRVLIEKAKAGTLTDLVQKAKEAPELVEGAKKVVEKGAEIIKEVVTKPEVIKEAVKETVKAPWNVGSWRQMIEQAVAAKAQAVQTASEQVRQIVQTGVEIAKGSHSWGAAETAAKQVIEASGVQSDPERLSILTDAINKAGGLSDLVQPGTKLMLKPETTADILAKAIEKTSQVIAHGGAEGLKVPADQEDLQALTRVVEFLRGLK